MKKLLVILLVMSSSTVNMAQKKTELSPQEVPAEVKNAYAKDFPTANLLNWEKESGKYEVTFQVGQTHMSAVYNKKGYRLEVERTIEESKLPPPVFEYIKKNFSGFTLVTASSTTTDKSVVTYETEITKGADKYELVFDSKGNFKKKEKED